MISHHSLYILMDLFLTPFLSLSTTLYLPSVLSSSLCGLSDGSGPYPTISTLWICEKLPSKTFHSRLSMKLNDSTKYSKVHWLKTLNLVSSWDYTIKKKTSAWWQHVNRTTTKTSGCYICNHNMRKVSSDMHIVQHYITSISKRTFTEKNKLTK